MGDALQPHGGVEPVDLIGVLAAIGDHPAQTDIVILRLGADGRDDPVHGEDGVEVIGGDDQGALGVLKGSGEAATDHIAQHVKDHHVGVVEQMVFLEQLHRLPDNVAAAAGAGGGSARFDAHHAVVAFSRR